MQTLFEMTKDRILSELESRIKEYQATSDPHKKVRLHHHIMMLAKYNIKKDTGSINSKSAIGKEMAIPAIRTSWRDTSE